MNCSFRSLNQQSLVLRKQNGDDIIDFQFPNLNFLKLKWHDSTLLHRELVRLGIKANFKAGKIFLKTKSVSMRTVRIVYKCADKYCKARLLYLQENKPNSEIYLMQFYNLHHHIKSKDLELAKKQDISMFILDLDQNIMDDFIQTNKWKDRFDLSKQKSLEIIQRVLWHNNTEEQIFQRFCRKPNVKVRRYRQNAEDGKTDLIFMSSDSMRDTFLYYGETISVGFTDAILTEKSVYEEKYIIGNFFAQDQNLRLLLLGSFVMTRNLQENWKKLFQFFYQCVCDNKDLVQTFVIDSQPNFVNGVLRFKQEKHLNFELLTDWVHVIERDLKPKLITHKNGKQVLDVLAKSFAELSPFKYDNIMEKSLKIFPEQHKQILQQFKMKACRYCFTKMPKKFQGFSMSSKFVKSLTIRTNQLLRFKNHTGRLFYQYLQIQKSLLKDSQNTVSSIRIGPIRHFTNELIFLRQKIELKVMEILVSKYSESKELIRIKIDDITYQIRPEQQQKQRGIIVRFNIEYDHWECQCRFIYLCGLPCEHLICIVSGMKGSIAYYINSRCNWENEAWSSYFSQDQTPQVNYSKLIKLLPKNLQISLMFILQFPLINQKLLSQPSESTNLH